MPDEIDVRQAVAEPEDEAEAAGGDAEAGAAGGLYELLRETGLPNILAVAGRELKAYFLSPIGWILGAVIILPISLFGYAGPVLGQGGTATLSQVYSVAPVLFIFVMPLYTMRLLSEEQQEGTLEILLTAPVRDVEVVIGKWLGVMGFYLASLAFTLVYILLLGHDVGVTTPVHVLGATVNAPDLEYGSILTGYAGVLMVGGAFAAIGLFISSLTQNQIISGFVTLVVLLVLWNLGYASFLVSPPLSDIATYLAANTHSNTFASGQIQLKDFVYFLSLIAASLFLATRVLESRRWR